MIGRCDRASVFCGVSDVIAYECDDIGNRLSSVEPDDDFTYVANNLNQYASISNSVPSVSPCETFNPTFDADGNQTLVKTKTGTWSITYNAENRPVSWACGATNLTMKFDRMGRRVEYLETVADAETSAVATNRHQRFVYDGYLCLQIINAQTGVAEYAFEWDPTEPVATRPMVMQRTGNWNLFYTHDGNKNVSELVYYQRARGVAAHYEYAPFGAVTVQTRGNNWGTLDFSALNPFRFSSEFADDTLGLVYYNYRHYEPMTGRWLTRDPIGGQMLYGFIGNQVISVNDFIGLLVSAHDDGRYSVDDKTCTMTVSMKIRFVFEDGKLGKWKEESKRKWASSVVKIVNAYFNGGYVSYRKEQYHNLGVRSPVKAYRCRSDCAKKCKDGISVDFKFAVTSESDYDFKLAVKYDDLRSWAKPAVQTSQTGAFGDSDAVVNGELSVNDNKEVPKRTVDGTEYWQIVVIHEIGHLLGMKHPGQTAENVWGSRVVADSEEDYDANAASLMGKGMVLTDTDFNAAFCSHIDKNKFGRGWEAK